MKFQCLTTLGLAVAMTILSSVGLTAADFRVETDVFADGQSKPVQQSLTLFSGGVAYDYSLDDPDRVTIVDVAQQRIVLLDAKQKVQSQVQLTELNAFIESARNQAQSSELSVCISDAEQVSFDEPQQLLTVGQKVTRYEAKLQTAPDEQVASQYRQFADATAHLNAWSTGTPPFARLALNAVVGNRIALPEEITRTSFPLGSNKSTSAFVVRCRLHVGWQLSADDTERVAKFQTMANEFATVPVQQLLAQPQKVASGSSNPSK